MTKLSELYREAVLDHNKNPRNVGELQNPDFTAQGHNPVCGDDVKIFIRVTEGKIASLQWTGKGCAVCKASTSIMSEILKDKTIGDAENIIQDFEALLKSGKDVEYPEKLEQAMVLSGVKDFPVRIKCALLGWKTALQAIKNTSSTVTTES